MFFVRSLNLACNVSLININFTYYFKFTCMIGIKSRVWVVFNRPEAAIAANHDHDSWFRWYFLQWIWSDFWELNTWDLIGIKRRSRGELKVYLIANMAGNLLALLVRDGDMKGEIIAGEVLLGTWRHWTLKVFDFSVSLKVPKFIFKFTSVAVSVNLPARCAYWVCIWTGIVCRTKDRSRHKDRCRGDVSDDS